jgi:hypothetical protein
MHYAFLAPDVPAPNRSNRYLFFIQVERFTEMAYDDAFTYEWSKRAPALLADQQAQWEQHLFPLAVIGQGGWELGNWVQGYAGHWQAKAQEASEAGDEQAATAAAAHADRAREFGDLLKGITEQYQVSYIELDRDLEIDKVCDIFTQVNSKGVRLDVFDLINALVKPKEIQLKKLWREAVPRFEFVESGRTNVYILQVMSILRQAYCSPKYLYFLLPGQAKTVREADGSFRQEVLVEGSAEFEALWGMAVEALGAAVDSLKHPQEFGAISSKYLPYVSILPAFAALQESARGLPPNKKLDAGRKLRLWYWSSVFTNRYSGSVESTAARDFLDVSSWFEDSEAEPALLAEFKARFRDLDLRREVKRGTSVYNGIFNLLILNGARDWMTGGVNVDGDLDDHHIVPKDWGAGQALDTSIDSILNRTPLTSETNRHVISDRLPNAYLPELIAENGEATVRATLESHFISPTAFDILLRDPFAPEHFEQFVAERQRSLQAAIEDLLIKGRLGLEPHVRELDARVEEIELRLREAIDRALDGDPARLPSHVRGKVAERIKAALRRNPGLDASFYEALAGQLEYCDLRELQDTIVSKEHWPAFEPCFGAKEGLAVRFNQLAELRNSIRHSRTVAEVPRRDGEAALTWFDDALSAGAPAGG